MVEPHVLFNVFKHTYSSCSDERQQAEAYLKSVERNPGFLVALLQIAEESQVDQVIRQAAAIQLKNRIKTDWEPAHQEAASGRGISGDEKDAILQRLPNAIARTFIAPGVRSQLVESLRLIAQIDYPERWPRLVDVVLADIRSNNTASTYGGLLVLRRLFKQLENKSVSWRTDMEALCTQTLPTLGPLGHNLAQLASQSGSFNGEALEMLTMVLKAAYSSLHVVVSDCMRQDLDTWMQLVLGVTAMARPTALQQADLSIRETSPFAKAQKWAFHILYRFFNRHGSRRRAVNGTEEFADHWAATYLVPATEICLREACALGSNGERLGAIEKVCVSRRTICLALLCISEGCSKDAAYNVIRPHLQTLLKDGVFPWVRFGPRDSHLWQEDPEELVRQFHGDHYDAYHEPREAALFLVERIVRHRQDEVLVPIIQFCRVHMDAHAHGDGDHIQLCANKDGALKLLGSMAEEIRSLDQTQSGRSKKKHGTRKTGGDNKLVNLEDLLNNYVRPDLSSTTHFLRLRACWFYEKVIGKLKLSNPSVAAVACQECLRLADDPELPVRVQACTSLKAFLEREGDQSVRKVLVENLGGLLERLLKTLAAVQNEEIAETLEFLVSEFPHEILPFAAQLVEQLVAQFCLMASAHEDDEVESAAMGSMQTILSVLHCCATLKNADDASERQRRVELFQHLSAPLLPVVQRLVRPDGIDYFEEALELLDYLSLYGPSPLSSAVWSVFPQLYQSVCGIPSNSFALSPQAEGWAPDFMPSLLHPLENFVTRGPPDAFLAGIWAEGGMSYPDMLFGIFRQVLHRPGVGSERECASAAKVCSIFFENIARPGADAWLPQYVGELWRRFPHAETAMLRGAITAAFASLIWYNAELCLQCTEERQCSKLLFETWAKHAKDVKSPRGRKRLVLALVRLLQMACSSALPAVLMSGMPHLLQELATQSKEIIRFRAAGGHDAYDEDDGDDASDADGVQQEDDDETDEDAQARDRSANHSSTGLRPYALGNVDELAILRGSLQQAPSAFQQEVDACLGKGAFALWMIELSSCS